MDWNSEGWGYDAFSLYHLWKLPIEGSTQTLASEKDGRESCLCFLTLSLWASDWTSLCLSFLTCKLESKIEFTSLGEQMAQYLTSRQCVNVRFYYYHSTNDHFAAIRLQSMDFFRKQACLNPTMSLLNSTNSPSYSLFQQLRGHETPSGSLFSSCFLYQKATPTCHLYLLISPRTHCPLGIIFFSFRELYTTLLWLQASSLPWSLNYTNLPPTP